jgi:hypothetical protein
MKSAWIITREGTRRSTEVLGILSARKSAKKVKEYLEWLYALLHCPASTHFDDAKYKKTFITYGAEFDRTNTGVPVSTLIRCGDNPWLVARLAKDASLVKVDGEASVMRWTDPDRLVCDTTPRIVEKIAGQTCQFPVRLPLNTQHIGADEEREIAHLPRSSFDEMILKALETCSFEELVLASMELQKTQT